MKDEANKSNKPSKEKTWKNLTKDYLTVDQKLAIIREYNGGKATLEWNKSIAAMRDYLEKRKK